MEKTVFKHGTFVDFTGVERNVTFRGLSTTNVLDNYKFLQIGVAIQSPGDINLPKFKNNKEIDYVKLSEIISKGKAEKKPVGTLISNNFGMINYPVVEALLEQELAYFKQNPGKYIVGYDKDKELYKKTPWLYLKKFNLNPAFNQEEYELLHTSASTVERNAIKQLNEIDEGTK